MTAGRQYSKQDLLPRVVGQHKLDVLEAGGENSKLGGQESEGDMGGTEVYECNLSTLYEILKE